jgi:hypothetical protein
MLVNVTLITQSDKWRIGILQFRLSFRNIIFYFPSPCDVILPSKWKETLTEQALLVRLKQYGFGFLPVAWCDVCVCPFEEESVCWCVIQIQLFILAFWSVLRQVRSPVKSSSPPSAIQCSHFQFPVSSRFLKVIRLARLPVAHILLSFLQQCVLRGSSCPRCDQFR